MYSVWSDTVDWAKKFTPKIPIGSNSKLFLVGPWTVVGALAGVLVGLKNKFSHPKPVGSVSNSGERDFHPTEVTKLSFEDLAKEIPGYYKLVCLCKWNCDLLKDFHSDNREIIYKYFPSFLSVCDPNMIYDFRKGNVKRAGLDTAVILSAYGEELLYYWNFNLKSWYVRDSAFNPAREFRIEGDILQAIKIVFDPKKNPLLEQRLQAWESNEELESKFSMREYVKVILELIDKANKITATTKIFSDKEEKKSKAGTVGKAALITGSAYVSGLNGAWGKNSDSSKIRKRGFRTVRREYRNLRKLHDTKDSFFPDGTTLEDIAKMEANEEKIHQRTQKAIENFDRRAKKLVKKKEIRGGIKGAATGAAVSGALISATSHLHKKYKNSKKSE